MRRCPASSAGLDVQVLGDRRWKHLQPGPQDRVQRGAHVEAETPPTSPRWLRSRGLGRRRRPWSATAPAASSWPAARGRFRRRSRRAAGASASAFGLRSSEVSAARRLAGIRVGQLKLHQRGGDQRANAAVRFDLLEVGLVRLADLRAGVEIEQDIGVAGISRRERTARPPCAATCPWPARPPAPPAPAAARLTPRRRWPGRWSCGSFSGSASRCSCRIACTGPVWAQAAACRPTSRKNGDESALACSGAPGD